MKLLLNFALLMGLLFYVGCNKDTIEDLLTDDTTLAVEELLTGTASLRDGGDSTGTSGHGHCHHPGKIKGDSIGFADLPQVIQDCLIANADTSAIKRIIRITLPDGSIRYGIRFNDNTHLHFDADGNVIPGHTPKGQFTAITFDELPAGAQDYLNTNNLTASIALVIKLTKPDGTVVYIVRLTDNKKYAFDADGNLVEMGNGPKKHKKRRGH
jgi:hypothetical protein